MQLIINFLYIYKNLIKITKIYIKIITLIKILKFLAEFCIKSKIFTYKHIKKTKISLN